MNHILSDTFLSQLSAFVAAGSDDSELPPRIQMLLQARLDLWPADEQRVLTTAALEGIEFHVAALEALLPEKRRGEIRRQLATLTRAGAIRPLEPHLEGSESFRFRHLPVVEDRKLRFEVEVREGDRVLGLGTHERRTLAPRGAAMPTGLGT